MAKKEDIVAWTCTECNTPTYPEDVMTRAMTSVSGKDVVTVGHCVCGNSALLSWTVPAWNKMHTARQAQIAQKETITEQRKASEIGREVAEFRALLETVDTVEEMGLTI